jgi:hypothetical protein
MQVHPGTWGCQPGSTEADLLRCIEAVDKRKDAGRPSKELAPSGANFSHGKSAETTAQIVGTSRRKVERARQVLSDPKEKEEIMAGKKTIHQASQSCV